MIKIKNALLFVLASTLLFSCYDAMEIDTENLGKVEIPVTIAAPLMDGSFVLEFDSFFNADGIGDDIITYEDGKAYFKYDTVVDFYDELTDFLDMDDVDFDDISSFDRSFGLDIDMPKLSIPLAQGQSQEIAPQDTFRANYNDANCVYFFPNDSLNESLDVLNTGDTIDLGIDYDIYEVQFSAGIIKLDISSSTFPEIEDDFMTMSSPLGEILMPIVDNLPYLPKAISIVLDLQVPSLYNTSGKSLNVHYEISTLDTVLYIPLSDYYYASTIGDGHVDMDLQAFFMITSPKDTAMVPLPDTLLFEANIEEVVFESILFDYGIDTVLSSRESFEIDAFGKLPNDLAVEGFRLLAAEMNIEVISNLGLPSSFEIKNLQFDTHGAPEVISNDNSLVLNLPTSENPMTILEKVVAGVSVLNLDSTNSRLDNFNILGVKGLSFGYDVVVNSPGLTNDLGKHNFFYNYLDDVVSSMYDVKLKAEVIIPFNFKFDKISFQETMESPIAANDLDSMFYLSDNDSIKLDVQVLTKDFPFNANAQFYFDVIDDAGELVHIDSMFAIPETLLPSSSGGVWDSVEWSVSIDADKYDIIKDADSLTFEVSMSMDEDDYFQLEEGYTTEVGYKFIIQESSFVIKQDVTDE